MENSFSSRSLVVFSVFVAAIASLSPFGGLKPRDATATSIQQLTRSTGWLEEFVGIGKINDWANMVALGRSGKAYMTGGGVGTRRSRNSPDHDDIYVRKYNSEGNYNWTRQFGTNEFDDANGVALDRSGNVYTVGYTSGAFPGQTSSGNEDGYIRKYDVLGNEKWTRQFGSGGHDFANGVAVDSLDNAYLVGYTTGALPGQMFSGGYIDAFIRKYDKLGNEKWTRQFGTSRWDDARSIALDELGNAYVVGYTSGALFDQRSSGGSDAFIGKFDSSGNTLWIRQFGSAGSDEGQGVAVDRMGNAYIVGHVSNAVPPRTSLDYYDALIRKYDSLGNEQWTRQFGSGGHDFGNGVAVDSSGNVYVVGYTTGVLPGLTSSGHNDAFIRKYDNQGNEKWTLQFGSNSGDTAWGIVVDSSRSIYVVGGTSGVLPGQTSSGSVDAFIMKLIEPPVAGFTRSLSPANGVAICTVSFIDTSTGSPTGWLWNFGDGTSSSSQNPSKTYYTPGNYTVTLRATNATGSHSTSQVVSIYGIPVASFTESASSGIRPLTVNFTDRSTGNIVTWLWSFGDGSASSSQNSSKTYANSGNYTVTLTASNPAGSSSVSAIKRVYSTPVAAFAASATRADPGAAINFTDESLGNITAWSWSFGDGTVSSSQSPSKSYASTGNYSVVLTATNVAGSNTIARAGYVTVTTSPLSLQAETSLSPDVDGSGYAVLHVRINRIKNAATGETHAIGDGLGAYEADITYDAGGVTAISISGVAPFALPAAILNTQSGNRTNFSASWTGSVSVPPLTLADLKLRLLGSKDIGYVVTLNFNTISRISSGAIPQAGAATVTIQRGDARVDGTVNITDAMFIAQYLAGLRRLGTDSGTVSATNAASVRHDAAVPDIGDKITIADALLIAQMLAGIRDASYNSITSPTPSPSLRPQLKPSPAPALMPSPTMSPSPSPTPKPSSAPAPPRSST